MCNRLADELRNRYAPIPRAAFSIGLQTLIPPDRCLRGFGHVGRPYMPIGYLAGLVGFVHLFMTPFTSAKRFARVVMGGGCAIH